MGRYPTTLLALIIVILAASGIATQDRLTWSMEVMPVLIAVPVLLWTWRPFPLTQLLYTYAHVPLGFWVQHRLGMSRNPYDKLGHFMQGFVPALIAREIFIRRRLVSGRRIQAFLCVCVAMFISADYELIEWIAAVSMGQGADQFLDTRGGVWDTQSDMASALLGFLSDERLR